MKVTKTLQGHRTKLNKKETEAPTVGRSLATNMDNVMWC